MLNAPIPFGQACGAGRLPRLWAPEQGSLAGGGPPLQEVLQDPLLQFTQDICASHPVEVIVKSEVNTRVMQPDVPVITPGLTFPVKVPMSGDAVLGPLYMDKKS